MSFRAVANQTNGRRKARQKENERWKQGHTKGTTLWPDAMEILPSSGMGMYIVSR